MAAERDDSDFDPDEEWDVDYIMDDRISVDGVQEFFVHWLGWTKRWDGWIPITQMSCDEKISKYFDEKAGKKRKKAAEAKKSAGRRNGRSLEPPSTSKTPDSKKKANASSTRRTLDPKKTRAIIDPNSDEDVVGKKPPVDKKDAKGANSRRRGSTATAKKSEEVSTASISGTTTPTRRSTRPAVKDSSSKSEVSGTTTATRRFAKSSVTDSAAKPEAVGERDSYEKKETLKKKASGRRSAVKSNEAPAMESKAHEAVDAGALNAPVNFAAPIAQPQVAAQVQQNGEEIVSDSIRRRRASKAAFYQKSDRQVEANRVGPSTSSSVSSAVSMEADPNMQDSRPQSSRRVPSRQDDPLPSFEDLFGVDDDLVIADEDQNSTLQAPALQRRIGPVADGGESDDNDLIVVEELQKLQEPKQKVAVPNGFDLGLEPILISHLAVEPGVTPEEVENSPKAFGFVVFIQGNINRMEAISIPEIKKRTPWLFNHYVGRMREARRAQGKDVSDPTCFVPLVAENLERMLPRRDRPRLL